MIIIIIIIIISNNNKFYLDKRCYWYSKYTMVHNMAIIYSELSLNKIAKFKETIQHVSCYLKFLKAVKTY